jgi:carboxyl-terminal processing protease
VTIGNVVRRDGTETIVSANPRSRFGGRLAVLIDGRSASSAEVLARVVQLERRGTVIGDRSSGSVMGGRLFVHEIRLGVFEAVLFGVSVTVADLIASDGQSLEHAGVTPDEWLIPSIEDVAEGRDPVLARAVEILGGQLDGGDAGTLFPYEWPDL